MYTMLYCLITSSELTDCLILLYDYSPAGDRLKRTCSGSLTSVSIGDSSEERPSKERGKRREKQLGKNEQHGGGHQDNPHGTNFIKRNIEVHVQCVGVYTLTSTTMVSLISSNMHIPVFTCTSGTRTSCFPLQCHASLVENDLYSCQFSSLLL